METLLVDHARPGIAVVTFNLPRSLNAMTPEFVHELSETLDQLANDQECRVIILTGAGRGFSSGHALDDLQTNTDVSGGPAFLRHQELYANLIVQLYSMPQAVVAAVNGPAAGGGLAMALAADTRVCSASARFNAAFARLGLSGCDVGVSYLLPKIVGPTLAFEMMLTGRLIDAAEAHRAGLVLNVVPNGEVLDAALEIAARICANAPFGVRMTKKVMTTNLDAPDLRSAVELENLTQTLCVATVDHAEALEAFIARRVPSFIGR